MRRVGEVVMLAVWGERWVPTVWGKRWRCGEAGDDNGGVGGLMIGHVFFKNNLKLYNLMKRIKMTICVVQIVSFVMQKIENVHRVKFVVEIAAPLKLLFHNKEN